MTSRNGGLGWRGPKVRKAGGRNLLSTRLDDNFACLNESCQLPMTCFSSNLCYDLFTFILTFVFSSLYIFWNLWLYLLFYSCHKSWTHTEFSNLSSTEEKTAVSRHHLFLQNYLLTAILQNKISFPEQHPVLRMLYMKKNRMSRYLWIISSYYFISSYFCGIFSSFIN